MWIKVEKFLIPLFACGVKFIEMKDDAVVFMLHHESSTTSDISTLKPVPIAHTDSGSMIVAEKAKLGEKEFARLTNDLNDLAKGNTYARPGLNLA